MANAQVNRMHNNVINMMRDTHPEHERENAFHAITFHNGNIITTMEELAKQNLDPKLIARIVMR